MKLKNLHKYPFYIADLLRRRFLSVSEGDARSISTGVTPYKYEILQNEIRKYKPKIVLECGSGKTTLIIAEELKKYGGKLVSMEEREKYYNDLKKIIPTHLKKYIELRLSPPAPDTYMMFRGVRYNNIPKYEYDYVFIDGPTTSWEGEKSFNFDFIYVVKNQKKPVRALIDTRMSTTFVLSLIFGDSVSFDYASQLGYVEPVTKKNMRITNTIIHSLPMYFVKRK